MFKSIASTFREESNIPWNDEIGLPIIDTLLSPAGQFSLSNLHMVAGRHAQYTFWKAFAAHIVNSVLTHDLDDVVLARFYQSSHPKASYLFNIFHIPTDLVLTNTQYQWIICHRMGRELPSLPRDLPHHCVHGCQHYPPSKGYPTNSIIYQ